MVKVISRSKLIPFQIQSKRLQVVSPLQILTEMATRIFLLVDASPSHIRWHLEAFLQNNKGVFTDVTSKICPELLHPGMVTAAVWTDFDNDHQIDLVLAGEWMPLRFLKTIKAFSAKSPHQQASSKCMVCGAA